MIALPTQPKSSVNTRPAFRVLCAWCEQTIERNVSAAALLTGNSHGICAPCAQQHFGLDLESLAAERACVA